MRQGRPCRQKKHLSSVGRTDLSRTGTAVQAMVPKENDLSRDGLHIGDDVGGEDDDPVRRQGVDEVAKAHPLPGI